jgi:hypothetical protein
MHLRSRQKGYQKVGPEEDTLIDYFSIPHHSNSSNRDLDNNKSTPLRRQGLHLPHPLIHRGRPPRTTALTDRHYYALQSEPLRPSERMWRSFQPLLLSHGYELRPRYHPNWHPSKICHESREHNLRGLGIVRAILYRLRKNIIKTFLI